MKNIFRTQLGDACTTLVDIIHHYTKAESVSKVLSSQFKPKVLVVQVPMMSYQKFQYLCVECVNPGRSFILKLFQVQHHQM